MDASASSFPSKGYARWYRVPPGDWKHGDLVIGTLRRNEKGYNVEDKEWFQIFGDAGNHAGGRVCELFERAEPIAKLSNFLRRPFEMKRIPSGDVYIRCSDAVAGPFRIEHGAGASSSNVYFTPERRAEGDVDVFDREAFDAAGGLGCTSRRTSKSSIQHGDRLRPSQPADGGRSISLTVV